MAASCLRSHGPQLPLLVLVLLSLIPLAARAEAEAAHNCYTGFLTCQKGWTDERKAWCLHHEAVQCPEGGKTKASKINLGLAWTLLGTVAFVTALFYLVNWPDKNVRRHAWSTISTAMSIAMALLIFESITEFVMLPVPKNVAVLDLLLSICFFFGWFCLLFAVIALLTGTHFEVNSDAGNEAWVVADPAHEDFGTEVSTGNVRYPVGNKSVGMINGLEVFVRRGKVALERRESSVKCWAFLLAHITGFAAINVGICLRQLQVFKSYPSLNMVAMLINQVFLACVFFCAKEVRRRTAKRDGSLVELAEEAEDDALGLPLAFLSVQVLGFWLTGIPSGDLSHEPDVLVGKGAMADLLLVGVLTGIAAIALPIIAHAILETPKQAQSIRRHVDMVESQGLMILAWTVIWATRWEWIRSRALESLGGPRSMGGRNLVALFLSLLSMLAIFGLHALEIAVSKYSRDLHRVVRAVQSCVNALGILAGFSWEKSFHGAISVVAEQTPLPGVVKLLLAAGVASVTISVWRSYVVEEVMICKRMFREEVDARHNAGGLGAYEQLEFEDLS